MKKTFLIFPVLLLMVALCGAGVVLAAPQQGLLVDEYGAPLGGFSNVWIEDGVAYPVYNPSTNLWYSVFIIGTGENGVILCAIGQPLGAGDNFGEGHENNQHEGGFPQFTGDADTDIAVDDTLQ